MSEIKLRKKKKAFHKVNKKKEQSFFTKEIEFNKRWSLKKKQELFNDLYLLLSSGIDLHSSLSLMVKGSKSKDKAVFSSILDNIISGDSLFLALDKTQKFDDYEIYSVRIGEETGMLSDVIFQLSTYFSNRVKQQRKIMSALSYPIMVMITAMFAVIFLVGFVVPMFADVFKRFQMELPKLTLWIISLSDKILIYIIILFLVIFSVWLVFRVFREKLIIKRIRSFIQMRTPVLGNLTILVHLTRFNLSMNMLTVANLPLLEALDLVQRMVKFWPLQSALINIREKITKGQGLQEAMTEYPELFDNRMLALIKVGEETNQLDKVFGMLKDQYMDVLEQKTGVIQSFIEPFLILFLGLVVGVILVSMYLPMFKLSGGVM